MTSNISKLCYLTYLLFTQRSSIGFIVSDEGTNRSVTLDIVPEPAKGDFVPIAHDCDFAVIVKATLNVGQNDDEALPNVPAEVAVKRAKHDDSGNCEKVMLVEKGAYSYLEEKNRLPFIPRFYMFGKSSQIYVEGILEEERYSIITDYVGKISLDKYVMWLKDHNKPNISAQEINILADKLFDMLVELYSAKVIHGNLKPQNILLTLESSPSDNGRITESTKMYLVDLSNALYNNKPPNSPLTEDLLWSSRLHTESHRKLEPTIFGDIESFFYILFWLGHEDEVSLLWEYLLDEKKQKNSQVKIAFRLTNRQEVQDHLCASIAVKKSGAMKETYISSALNLTAGLKGVLMKILGFVELKPNTYKIPGDLEKFANEFKLLLPSKNVKDGGSNEKKLSKKLSLQALPRSSRVNNAGDSNKEKRLSRKLSLQALPQSSPVKNESDSNNKKKLSQKLLYEALPRSPYFKPE